MSSLAPGWKSKVRLDSLACMRFVGFALALLAPATAFAHPLIDEARRSYDSAQHEEALALLERAEAGTDLTREDLAELLLLRAMVHRAQRRMDLAEVDLLRLAGLDPARRLGREVHPSLRRLFDTVRERVPGPVRLEVSAERNGNVVRVRAAVTDDVAALTQSFRVHARPAGGTWRQSDAAMLEVTVEPYEAAEYYAEAIGPGGAVIANYASRDAPGRLEPEGAAADPVHDGPAPDPIAVDPETPGPRPAARGEEIPAWPFIVGGAVALAIGAAILVGVLAAQPTGDSQLTPPRVEGLASAPLPLLRFQ